MNSYSFTEQDGVTKQAESTQEEPLQRSNDNVTNHHLKRKIVVNADKANIDNSFTEPTITSDAIMRLVDPLARLAVANGTTHLLMELLQATKRELTAYLDVPEADRDPDHLNRTFITHAERFGLEQQCNA